MLDSEAFGSRYVKIAGAPVDVLPRLTAQRRREEQDGQTQALIAIGQSLGSLRDLPALFELVQHHLAAVIPSQNYFLTLVGRDGCRFERKLGAVGGQRLDVRVSKLDLEGTICALVLRRCTAFLFQTPYETGSANQTCIRSVRSSRRRYPSFIAAPVISQGTPVAILGAKSPLPGRFSDADARFLEEVGTLIGPAVHALLTQSEIEGELRRELNELHLLHRRTDEEKESLAAILENTPDIIISLDLDKRIVSWNGAAEKILGWRADEVVGDYCFKVLQCKDTHGQGICQHDCRFDFCLDNKVPSVRGRRHFIVTRDGRTITAESSLALIPDDKQRTTKAVYVLRDVSTVVRKEQDQRASLQRLRRLTNDLSNLYHLNRVGSAALDLPEALRMIAEGAARVLGVTHGAVLLKGKQANALTVAAAYAGMGHPIFSLDSLIFRENDSELFEILKNHNTLTRVEASEHDATPVSSLYVSIVDGSEALGLIAVAECRYVKDFANHDESRMKSLANQAAIAVRNARLYEQVQSDLTTKSTLVQEMHHRIKNGLQTVAGLMRLEILEGNAPVQVKEMLEKSITRIDSVADVHELLSQVGQERIAFCDLVEKIVQTVKSEMSASGHISITTSGVSLELPCKQAVSLGLIINELLCNAVEHAFPERERGNVELRMERSANAFRLEVEDDGIGLPPGFELASSSHLGLQIVQKLAERDLGGSLSLESVGGTKTTVTFPGRMTTAI